MAVTFLLEWFVMMIEVPQRSTYVSKSTEERALRENWNIEASRTIAGALTRRPLRCHVRVCGHRSQKISQKAMKMSNYSQVAAARDPLQLLWRPRAAAEAGAAASGAAGMPVRWPRRPAAVSEAVVADAEPDFSCAGELEQPLKALIGKVCRPPVGRSVAWSVARSVLVELSISCGGVLCLGSSAAAGALGFPAPGYWIYGRSAFVRVSSSVMDAVCVCLLARLLRRVAPRFSCPGLFVCLVLARAWDCNRRWLDEAARCYHARAASARGALCAVFGVCGCGAF